MAGNATMKQDHVIQYGATIYSLWGMPLDGSEPDMERHLQFCAYVSQVLQEHMPDLAIALSACGARITAVQGAFSFSLPSEPNVWHAVPSMAEYLKLLPWVEPHETAH